MRKEKSQKPANVCAQTMLFCLASQNSLVARYWLINNNKKGLLSNYGIVWYVILHDRYRCKIIDNFWLQLILVHVLKKCYENSTHRCILKFTKTSLNNIGEIVLTIWGHSKVKTITNDNNKTVTVDVTTRWPAIILIQKERAIQDTSNKIYKTTK